MPEQPIKKGRPTPKAPQNSKGRDPMTVAADRQRAQHYGALQAEAEQIEEQAYREGMALLRKRKPYEDVAFTIVSDVLAPALAEAEIVRHTAQRFAPIERQPVHA